MSPCIVLAQTQPVTSTSKSSIHHRHHTAQHKTVIKKTTHARKTGQHKKITASRRGGHKRSSLVSASNLGERSEVTPIISTENVAPAPSFVSSIKQRLVNLVDKTVDTLRYSAYKLGGKHFDASQGVYILDCSNYVDHVLQLTYPNAYSSLVNSTGSESPTSQHYYDFFTRLSDDHPKHYWNKVDDVNELEPGDILVFRYKNHARAATQGHVMIVMDKPISDDTNALLVRVADSAPSGHSEDTRLPHDSGIGIGTLLIKADPKTGHPFAYAWKFGSRWKKNVSFAMGRPVDMKDEY